MTIRRLFCFGFGYSAGVLADRLRCSGWAIAGTVREAERLPALAGSGIAAHLFAGTAPLDAAGLQAFKSASHVLVSVPPDGDGDPVLRHHAAAIAAAADRLQWLGYLSTTGVYGDRGGGWVDEDSACTPTTERGRRRLAAEEAWLALWRRHGVPVHRFRLAGIYGPGRNQLDSVAAGTARRIDKPGQIFSRIHVEDIAAVLLASIGRPHPGRAYNVCDDEPASPAEVVAYAAGLLGRAPPPLVGLAEAGLSGMGRSFYEENKRVRNDRIKQELGVTLRYRSYREGLQALAAAGAGGG